MASVTSEGMEDRAVTLLVDSGSNAAFDCKLKSGSSL